MGFLSLWGFDAGCAPGDVKNEGFGPCCGAAKRACLLWHPAVIPTNALTSSNMSAHAQTAGLNPSLELGVNWFWGTVSNWFSPFS